MQKVFIVALFWVVLLASASLIYSQAEGAATVSGHIEPRGTLYTGDNATLVLEFNTSPVLGGEYLDEEGRFKFDVHATLRLDGNTSLEPIQFGGGFYIRPEAVRFPIRIEPNHPLTEGKWIVNATVYQQMQHDLLPVDMHPSVWEFDVVQKPEDDYGPLLTIIGWGVGIVGSIAAGIVVVWWTRRHPHRGDIKKDKRAEMQRINEQIRALPPEYMQNLRYHYCKLKNNARPIDFSYHPKPALRNQADTIEQTLDTIASAVLDNAVDFREFKRLHGPFILKAWVLCQEDIAIRAKTYPGTGSKFKRLFNKLAKTMQVPEIDCSDVTEKMPDE